MRLLREVLEDTAEICEGKAAVACRIVVDELLGTDGQGRSLGLGRSEMEDVFGLIGEVPDLWDLMVGEWDFDSSTSRFEQEGYSEPFVHGFKQLTSKPVVIVGRYTSPDTMVRLVRQGITDFIGAARPSIADPFLPRKIGEGRLHDIRECIGCNVCVASDWLSVPIRCTQNPSMGEEWRRGWHPERITPAPSAAPRPRCWSSVPARRGWKPHCGSAVAGTRWCSPKRRASWAVVSCARPGFPGSPSGAAWPTTGCCSCSSRRTCW